MKNPILSSIAISADIYRRHHAANLERHLAGTRAAESVTSIGRGFSPLRSASISATQEFKTFGSKLTSIALDQCAKNPKVPTRGITELLYLQIVGLECDFRASLLKYRFPKDLVFETEPTKKAIGNFRPPKPDKPNTVGPKRGHEIKFMGEGLVQYKGKNYPVTNDQEKALKACLTMWIQAGNTKTLVRSRQVLGLDADKTIGRVFKGHAFLMSLGVLKQSSKGRGAFIFNP